MTSEKSNTHASWANIVQVHQLLNGRRTFTTRAELVEKLGCSTKTIDRAIEKMQDQLNAPIEKQTGPIRYRYEKGMKWEVPGFWLEPEQLTALLCIVQWLQVAEPGLLENELLPIQQWAEDLLSKSGISPSQAQDRIRIVKMQGRPTGSFFNIVTNAVLDRQQLHIVYDAGATDTSERYISPQRLTYYRDTWYVDAWCHWRQALRSFSIASIKAAKRHAQPALEIKTAEMDAHYASSYGIFGGEADKTAILKFTPFAARWVSQEQWHPQQVGQALPDGSYQLTLPYKHSPELVKDILRHGANVHVLHPAELQTTVAEQLKQAYQQYFS